MDKGGLLRFIKNRLVRHTLGEEHRGEETNLNDTEMEGERLKNVIRLPLSREWGSVSVMAETK